MILKTRYTSVNKVLIMYNASLIVLNIKVPETSISAANTVGSSGNTSTNTTGNKKGIAFDWIPPDVPEDVVSVNDLTFSVLPHHNSFKELRIAAVSVELHSYSL